MSKTIKSSDGIITIGSSAITSTNSSGIAIQIPNGGTTSRPTGPALSQGQFRFNNDIGAFEGYNGVAWKAMATTIVSGPIVLASYTVTQLATLSTSVGSIVYCTNVGTGAEPVFWDGTNWRKFSTRDIVT